MLYTIKAEHEGGKHDYWFLNTAAGLSRRLGINVEYSGRFQKLTMDFGDFIYIIKPVESASLYKINKVYACSEVPCPTEE